MSTSNVYLGLKFKTGETGTCSLASCDGKLIWDDGSDFSWDNYTSYLKSVTVSSTHNNLYITQDGKTITSGNGQQALVCGKPCDEVTPQEKTCYQYASFSTHKYTMQVGHLQKVCGALGETLPMPKTGEQVGRLMTWIRRESGKLITAKYLARGSPYFTNDPTNFGTLMSLIWMLDEFS